MFVALGLLSLTSGMTVLSLTRKFWATDNSMSSSETLGGLAKRGLDVIGAQESLKDDPWIRPIVSRIISLRTPWNIEEHDLDTGCYGSAFTLTRDTRRCFLGPNCA